ncbi:MAG: MotA/TolQ/ExbB proton channel family protein [Phycisphaerales bacterium]
MNTGMLLAQTEAAQPEALGSVFELATRGGIMMIPIAICSLIVVAVVAERVSVLRRTRVVPPDFRESFDRAGSDADAARKACGEGDSPAARVVLAGLDKLGHVREVIEKHIASAGEREVYLMRRRLRALTVIGAIAPLLGLTGTIFGMIRAFATVAESGESLGRAEMLAGGIYEAMITTAAGLLVAIPTVVCYHWLAGRVERLARELDEIAVLLVERFVLEPGGTQRSGATPNGATKAASNPAMDPAETPTAVGGGAS